MPPTPEGLRGEPVTSVGPPSGRGTIPVALMGAEICLGADIAGFLDFLVFLNESPLLSDIFSAHIKCVEEVYTQWSILT